MEENIPSDGEAAEYNWAAIAAWFNARYGTTFKDKDLRRFAIQDGGETTVSTGSGSKTS